MARFKRRGYRSRRNYSRRRSRTRTKRAYYASRGGIRL